MPSGGDVVCPALQGPRRGPCLGMRPLGLCSCSCRSPLSSVSHPGALRRREPGSHASVSSLTRLVACLSLAKRLYPDFVTSFWILCGFSAVLWLIYVVR